MDDYTSSVNSHLTFHQCGHNSLAGIAKAGAAKAGASPLVVSPSFGTGPHPSYAIMVACPSPDTYRLFSHGDAQAIVGGDGTITFGTISSPNGVFPFDGAPHTLEIVADGTMATIRLDGAVVASGTMSGDGADAPLYVGGGADRSAPWAINASLYDMRVGAADDPVLHYAFDSSDPLGAAIDSSPHARHGTVNCVRRVGEVSFASHLSSFLTHLTRFGEGVRIPATIMSRHTAGVERTGEGARTVQSGARMGSDAFRRGSGIRTSLTSHRPLSGVLERLGAIGERVGISHFSPIFVVSPRTMEGVRGAASNVGPATTDAARYGLGIRKEASNVLPMRYGAGRVGSGSRATKSRTRPARGKATRVGAGNRVAVSEMAGIMSDTSREFWATAVSHLAPYSTHLYQIWDLVRQWLGAYGMAMDECDLWGSVAYPVAMASWSIHTNIAGNGGPIYLKGQFDPDHDLYAELEI